MHIITDTSRLYHTPCEVQPDIMNSSFAACVIVAKVLATIVVMVAVVFAVISARVVVVVVAVLIPLVLLELVIADVVMLVAELAVTAVTGIVVLLISVVAAGPVMTEGALVDTAARASACTEAVARAFDDVVTLDMAVGMLSIVSDVSVDFSMGVLTGVIHGIRTKSCVEILVGVSANVFAVARTAFDVAMPDSPHGCLC